MYQNSSKLRTAQRRPHVDGHPLQEAGGRSLHTPLALTFCRLPRISFACGGAVWVFAVGAAQKLTLRAPQIQVEWFPFFLFPGGSFAE